MGTNYYHITDACPTCGIGSEVHIGKNMTMFAAVVDWDAFGGPTIVVGSWQEWKERLLAAGHIRDEYDKAVPTGEFIANVESTEMADRRREFDWMVDNRPEFTYDEPVVGGEWLDADGFSFATREFT